jgi:hypothetical protein
LSTGQAFNRGAKRLGRWSWALAVPGFVAWVWLGGCHEFHACYDEQCVPLDTSQGGDDSAPGGGYSAGRGGSAADMAGEEGSQGGTAGAAGNEEGGAPACPPPSADCDESTFTICESNLFTDLGNCGACGARCGGICVQGTCHPFEALVQDLDIMPHGGVAFTPSEAFALSNYGFGSELVSWSLQGGPRTLFAHGDDFQTLASGVDRLYLLGADLDSNLFSVSFSGGTLVHDDVTARAAVVLKGFFYGVDANSVAYRRDETSHERIDIPLPVALPQFAAVALASDGRDVGLVAADGDGYHAYQFVDGNHDTPPSWQLVASGNGGVGQLRVANRALYLDAVLDPENSDVEDDTLVMHELRELSFDGGSRVLAREQGVLAFELGSRSAYLSLQRPNFKAALRIVPLDDPSLFTETETAGAMASLSLVHQTGPQKVTIGYLYFGDTHLHTFSRLPAWLE